MAKKMMVWATCSLMVAGVAYTAGDKISDFDKSEDGHLLVSGKVVDEEPKELIAEIKQQKKNREADERAAEESRLDRLRAQHRPVVEELVTEVVGKLAGDGIKSAAEKALKEMLPGLIEAELKKQLPKDASAAGQVSAAAPGVTANKA
ncbi:hypothetical protein [Sphingorhabdus sp. 109]|uniref:hypothetical protein n=1 Tax=Sphingorhabdus sp. 109 TaxID=2653173 RepID=UPI0012F0AD77|nr:hypothetical protein [Sphingorhabdus sp. 109]VWX56714.1 exported hypothetical protein [Sphingorhabdus sp. 109]